MFPLVKESDSKGGFEARRCGSPCGRYQISGTRISGLEKEGNRRGGIDNIQNF